MEPRRLLSVSVAASGPSTVVEGSSYAFTASFTDPTGYGVDDLRVYWGNGASSSYPRIAGTGTSVTLYNDYSEPGNYSPYVFADAHGVAYGTSCAPVVVTEAQPTLSATPSCSVVDEGSAYLLNTSFLDPGGDAPISEYVDWRDGSSDSVSGAASQFQHSYSEPGTYAPIFGVQTEDGSYSGGGPVAIVNEATPTISIASPCSTVDVGSTYEMDTYFFDPGGDVPALAEVDWGDGTSDTFTGFDSNSASGVNLGFTHAYSQANTYSPTFLVQTEDGSYYNSTAADIGSPTSIYASAACGAVDEGSTYTLDTGFTPAAGDSVTGEYVDWGDGHSDTVNGAASQFQHSYTEPGSFWPTFGVWTAGGGFYSASVPVVFVNEVMPSLSATGDASSVDEGSLYTLNTSFYDPGGDAPSSMQVLWGDGTSDTFTGFDAASAAGVSLPFQHVYDEPGSFVPALIVQTEDGSFYNSGMVTVNEVPPSFSVAESNSVLEEGSTYSVSVNYSDPGGDPVEWSVNYGDGQTDTLVDLPGSGDDLSHIYGESGSYTVSVTGTTDDTSYTTTYVVTVSDVTPSFGIGGIAANEGSSFVLYNAFSDPGGDTPTGMLYDWGDGHSDSLAGYSSAASHVYSEAGSYAVTATALTENGSYSSTFSAEVQEVAPIVSASGSSTVTEGSSYILTTSFSDPGSGDPATAWDVNWDDQHSSSYSGNPGSFSHVYSEPGSYTVTATAHDEDGPVGASDPLAPAYTASTIITVTEATPTFTVNPSPSVVDASSTVNFNVTFNDPGGDNIDDFATHFIIDYGDGSTDEVVPGSTTSFSHSYRNGGTQYTVRVLAETADGAFAATAAVNVNPASTSSSSDTDDSISIDGASPSEGSAFDLTFTGTDGSDSSGSSGSSGSTGSGSSGSSGSSGPSGSSPSGDSTYVIDFGDGTDRVSADGYLDGSHVFHGSASHDYSEEGQYVLTVYDDDGDTASELVNVSESSPVLTPPPEQVVGTGQSLHVTASYSGLDASDPALAYVDWNDGTGAHEVQLASGVINADLASAPAPGVYNPTITLVNDDTTTTESFTLDVWGVVLGDGTNTDLLTATPGGTGNLQPLTAIFPHPAGDSLDLTLGTTDATDTETWDTSAPAANATPLLGGDISTLNFNAPASQSSRTFYVGAVKGNTTLNVLKFILTGAVNGTAASPPSGGSPVPSQPVYSNPASIYSATITLSSDPNSGKTNISANGTTRNWLVGQYVDLTATVTGPPKFTNLTFYKWNIPSPFKGG